MTKQIKILTLLTILFASFQVKANQCQDKIDSIVEKIKTASSCFDTADCYSYSFGCPFEPLDCMYSALAKSNEKIANEIHTNIEQYYRDECKTPTHCNPSAECNFPAPNFVCVEGACVNQTQALYINGNKPLKENLMDE